jgi:hypothetical protein
MRATRLSLADRAAAVKDALRNPAVLGLDGLRWTGRQWMARSPWRDERTASCSIRDMADGLAFNDFGGRGGNVLHVLAALHGLASRGADFAKVVEIGEQLAGITPGEVPPPRPTARPTPSRVPPPELEVRGQWEAALPVSSDAEAVAWLEERHLDVDRIEERGLARVLPKDVRLPRWAYGPGGTWTSTGHRLLVPTFNEEGRMVSLHARRIAGADDRKTLWPAGHRAVGVFADPLARRLLREGRAPTWWSSPTVIIAEGVPDFLTFAVAYGDSESCPAVFGIAAGTWTQAIADRIPDGCRIELACDGDRAGAKYNDEIARTFDGRCEVFVVEVDHAA